MITSATLRLVSWATRCAVTGLVVAAVATLNMNQCAAKAKCTITTAATTSRVELYQSNTRY